MKNSVKKNLHVKMFLWIWQAMKIKHAKIMEHPKLEKLYIVANVCLYSHVHLQRIQDQQDIINSSFLLMNM